jgi:hypothetical protein
MEITMSVLQQPKLFVCYKRNNIVASDDVLQVSKNNRVGVSDIQINN